MLNDNDCLEHVILVGSWAEYVYQEAGLLEDFDANIKTMDMDFLIKNLNKPMPVKNVAALARVEGYLVESDILTGVTKIYDKAGLEIEFLIGKRGAGVETALETNLGVTAQALRHMEILSRNTIDIDYFGMKITVPSPEAYTIHKIVINKERGVKQEKDQRAIGNIWHSLDAQEINRIVDTLTTKERKIFEQYYTEHNLNQQRMN